MLEIVPNTNFPEFRSETSGNQSWKSIPQELKFLGSLRHTQSRPQRCDLRSDPTTKIIFREDFPCRQQFQKGMNYHQRCVVTQYWLIIMTHFPDALPAFVSNPCKASGKISTRWTNLWHTKWWSEDYCPFQMQPFRDSFAIVYVTFCIWRVFSWRIVAQSTKQNIQERPGKKRLHC